MNLVVGATGLLGGAVALELRRRGEPVRALVRPATPARLAGPHTSAEALRDAGVELVDGDLGNVAALRSAMRGVQRVITTANSAKRAPQDDVAGVDRAGNAALIDAAAEAQVEQLVFISALGADAASPNPLLAAKGATEERLRSSGVPYTVLQPAMFMEDWIGFLVGSQLARGAQLTLVGDGRKRHAFVALADVAALAVAVLGRTDAQNQTLPLSGAAASYREVAARYQQALGQPLEIATVPPGAPVPGLPPVMSELWAGLEAGPEVDLVTSDVAAQYGIELTDLDRFIAGSLQRLAGKSSA